MCRVEKRLKTKICEAEGSRGAIASPEDEFYIVDLRPSFKRNPYITFWRAACAGYAYPLAWSGRFKRSEIDAKPSYFEIGRAHVCTPVTNAHLVCCLLIEKKTT